MDAKTLAQLLNDKAFDHPTCKFKIIETHISWVILTGDYAYKIKKPVKFDFVDFSSLMQRRFFCEEEFRLNRVLCPDLYIGVCPIIQTETENPRIICHSHTNDNPDIYDVDIIDYAIKMKQFNEHALLNFILRGNNKLYLIMDDIAQQLSAFYQKTLIVPIDSPYGNLLSISEPLLDNFKTIDELYSIELMTHKSHTEKSLVSGVNKNLTELKTFCLEAFQKLTPVFLGRKKQHFIRDCHGDLHLGNLFLDPSISEHICIFDRVEFNLNFRFIDTINDIAFLFMDLKSQSHHHAAFRFLNSYLEITGDYAGLLVLNFYAIYRALVRAKVALLTKNKNFNRNLNTALQIMQLQQTNQPLLIIMHGISGSGKTFLAKQLAPHISAILIRSDVERKRLFSEINIELYSEAMSKLTFDKLLNLSEIILNSGYSVIVDATFLKIAHRKPFLDLSQKLNCPVKILHCECAIETMHQRVTKRFRSKQDASDADSRVVELQLLENENLTDKEKKQSITIDTAMEIDINHLATLI